MSPFLLDVNVLLALHRPSHEAYRKVHHWFRQEGQRAFSTCAMTQAGFIRLMMNPALAERQVEAQEARQLLGELTKMKGHSFLHSDINFLDATAPFAENILGHRQVTDAYLLGLAIQEKNIFTTLDKAVRHLASNGHSKHVFVIE